MQAFTPRERPCAESPARPSPQRKGGARKERHECCVRVVARFRPPVTEDEQERPVSFRICNGGQAVESSDGSYHFDLDCAFPEDSSQEDVYAYVGKPIVEDVLCGYNGTAFAYGQTGSGKTYAMFGPPAGDQELDGIVPRAAREIFSRIAAGIEGADFAIHCSFLEVYREQMRDLLNPDANHSLRVKELPQRGLCIHNLSQEPVKSAAEVLSFVADGSRRRSVATTRQNTHSSRSHAILVLTVEQHFAEGAERLGKLTLVDLAGSEKVSKSECVGETLEEAKKINWSLTALGKVIDSLAEQRPHVPYRDSRLTRVLEEALGGNCRTTLLVAASACARHHDETLSSLRFATRAKKVRCHAKVNYVYSSDQLLQLVAQLQLELARARRETSLTVYKILPLDASPGAASTPAPGSKLKRQLGQGLATMGLAGLAGLAGLRLATSGSAPGLGKSFLEESGLEEVTELDFSPGCTSVDGREALSFSREGTPSRKLPRQASTPMRRRPSRALREEDSIEFQDYCFAEDPRDEAWRLVALAARNAVLCMEDTLVAQEQTLQSVLHTERTAVKSASTATTIWTPNSDSQCSLPGMESLSERFRSLRHALDARELRSMLEAERRKREALELELEMQSAYSEELERTLEQQATARPTEILKSLSSSQSNNQSSTPLPKAEASAAPKTEASVSEPVRRQGDSARKSTAGQRSTVPVVTGSSAPTSRGSKLGTSASTAPLGLGPRSGRSSLPQQRTRRPTGEALRPGTHHADPREGAHQKEYGMSKLTTPTTAGSAGNTQATTTGGCNTQAHSTPSSSPTLVSRGTLGGSVSLGDSFSLDISTSEHHADLQGSRQTPVASARLSPAALKARVEQLEEEVKQKRKQLADMATEVSSQGVSTSTLRHAVRVKAALLGQLEAEQFRKDEESSAEVERLMEKAMSALATIVSAQQLSIAAAEGERAIPV